MAMDDKSALRLAEDIKKDKFLKEKVDLDTEYAHQIPGILSKLKSNEKTYLLEYLLVNYWKNKREWYIKDEYYSAAMIITLDILPVQKISQSLRKFIIENSIELLNRASKEHREIQKYGFRGVDYPDMDMSLQDKIFQKFLFEDGEEDEILTYINENKISESVTYPILQAIYKNYLLPAYDQYSMSLKHNFDQLDLSHKKEIAEIFEFAKKTPLTGKVPKDSYKNKVCSFKDEKLIDFNLLTDFLISGISMPIKNNIFYWHGSPYEDYHTSNVLNIRNQKILRTIFYLYNFCNSIENVKKIKNLHDIFNSIAIYSTFPLHVSSACALDLESL